MLGINTWKTPHLQPWKHIDVPIESCRTAITYGLEPHVPIMSYGFLVGDKLVIINPLLPPHKSAWLRFFGFRFASMLQGPVDVPWRQQRTIHHIGQAEPHLLVHSVSTIPGYTHLVAISVRTITLLWLWSPWLRPLGAADVARPRSGCSGRRHPWPVQFLEDSMDWFWWENPNPTAPNSLWDCLRRYFLGV